MCCVELSVGSGRKCLPDFRPGSALLGRSLLDVLPRPVLGTGEWTERQGHSSPSLGTACSSRLLRMSQDPLRGHSGTWVFRCLECFVGYQWAVKIGFWKEAKLSQP